jgi:hypothetical protein
LVPVLATDSTGGIVTENGIVKLLRDIDRPELIGEGPTQEVFNAIADGYPPPSSNSRYVVDDAAKRRARRPGILDDVLEDELELERRLTFKTVGEWREDYTAPAWLIRGFMTADAFDVIGGAEKSLKTWLMHHCAIAVAAGVPLFGDPFMLATRGKVLLLTGEGGVNLVIDRLDHLADGIYHLDGGALDERIIVTADIAPLSSEHFAGDLEAVIAAHDPALVQLDPMYVYLGEDREAGNVYSVGPALSQLRACVGRRALQVAHHFTKRDAAKLTLASLTQAGMREAVDHWLLINIIEAELGPQRFVLDMDRGARRGLAWARRAEVILGPFDTDTLRHRGEPSFAWRERSEDSNALKVEKCAVAATEALKREDATGVRGFAKDWLETTMSIAVAATTKRAGIAQAVSRQAIRTEHGPHNSTLHFYVRDYVPSDPRALQ